MGDSASTLEARKLVAHAWTRWVAAVLLCLTCTIRVAIVSLRMIALPLLLVVVILALRWAWRGVHRGLRTSVALFVLATLSPVDVSFRNVDGPQRLIPARFGYPTPTMREQAARGELFLGGDVDITLLDEPRWMLVW